MSDWKPIETAPENPTVRYLVVDCLGNVTLTQHPRATLMHAGWAEAWAPVPEWIKPQPPIEPYSPQKGGREIAAMHAREFKCLVKGHGIAHETIEGVKVVRSQR